MDREIVERAQHGDREAYETLARDSARRLFLICQRILRDPDQAEDAAQRALVEMWRDLPGLRDPDRFEAWSYRLAVRCSLAEARRERRFHGAVGSIRLLPNDADADPPNAFATVDDRAALEDAFGRLTAEQRAVVVLRYFVGLPLDEIARVVAVPVGTVASRLHYALRAMRRTLESDEPPALMNTRLPA